MTRIEGGRRELLLRETVWVWLCVLESALSITDGNIQVRGYRVNEKRSTKEGQRRGVKSTSQVRTSNINSNPIRTAGGKKLPLLVSLKIWERTAFMQEML